MLHRDNYVFINGTSFEVGAADLVTLQILANDRDLAPEIVMSASEDVIDALHTWYKDGWVTLQ